MNVKDAIEIEREIASDYFRQRQEATATKSGFSSMGRDEYVQWLDTNRGRLINDAKKNGLKGKAARETVDRCRQVIGEMPVDTTFGDFGGYLILDELVGEVENVCRDGSVPIRDGVVFGTSPEYGLGANQMPVLTTEASIISVSVPFLPFCNMVSKSLTLSMPLVKESQSFRISHDPTEVSMVLRSQPELLAQWARIIAAYAIHDWLPETPSLTLSTPERNETRLRLLKSMELFAVAHEYGHHILKHGQTTSTAGGEDAFEQEYQADSFARSISMVIGTQSDPPNFYAASGAGGVLVLGVLELVNRAKAVLNTGADQLQPNKTHPKLTDRILNIAALDKNAPQDHQAAFFDTRACFMAILEELWEQLNPTFLGLHEENVRPTSNAQDPCGWLPLTL